jgi:cation diffusion facilitator CzcD-associated flavoprotein CzcO
VYQSTFSPSRDWSEHYAQGAEIKAYWSAVAKKYDIQKYARFNHEVLSANWSDDKGKWHVSVRHEGTTTIAEADCLIMATGTFSHPVVPKFPGISDYEGLLFHSSRWDAAFDPKDKSIAIIGNGSSGLQILPQIQKVARHIDHYVRSPTWIAGSFGAKEQDDNRGKPIPSELKSTFDDTKTYLEYRKRLEDRTFSSFGGVMKDSPRSKSNRAQFYDTMKAKLGNRKDLLNAIVPDFSPSCRRLTPGPGYLEALLKPNVEYISSPIERFTKTGIRTVDGRERDVDAIVCCTGSDKSLAPPFPVINGLTNLASAWRPGGSIGFPKTYLGVAAPGFPNLFFVNGPSAASATGTLPVATENQITLIARIVRKLQTQGIRTITPSLQATEDFQAYCEAYFPHTVMSEECSSWFNGGIKGGRVIANWPGSGLHANVVRREPRWEDWEYTYRSDSKNRFAYFGNGWTTKDVYLNHELGLQDTKAAGEDLDQSARPDLTPYLHIDSITGQLDLRNYHETWYNV